MHWNGSKHRGRGSATARRGARAGRAHRPACLPACLPADDDAEESEEEGRPAAPPTDAPLPLGDDEFPDEALALVCRFLGLRELGRLACAARRFTETLTEPGGGGLHSLGSCPPELQRVLA